MCAENSKQTRLTFCATVRERARTGDPPRPVEVVARPSRRRDRSACRRRPVNLTIDRHAGTGLTRSTSPRRAAPSVFPTARHLVPSSAFSSFLLHPRGRAFHLLRFQRISPIVSLSCLYLRFFRYADIRYSATVSQTRLAYSSYEL